MVKLFPRRRRKEQKNKKVKADQQALEPSVPLYEVSNYEQADVKTNILPVEEATKNTENGKKSQKKPGNASVQNNLKEQGQKETSQVQFQADSEKNNGFNLVGQDGSVIKDISKVLKGKGKSSSSLKKCKSSKNLGKAKLGSATSLIYKSSGSLPAGQQQQQQQQPVKKKKKKKQNVPTSDHALIHFIKWFNSGLRGAARKDYRMPIFPAREEEFLHLLDDGFVMTMILSMIKHAGVSSEEELKIINDRTPVLEADANKRCNIDFVINKCRWELAIPEQYIFEPIDVLGYTREDLEIRLSNMKDTERKSLDSDPVKRDKFLRTLKQEGNIVKVCITLRYMAKSAVYNPEKGFYKSIPEPLRREIKHIPDFGGFSEAISQVETEVPAIVEEVRQVEKKKEEEGEGEGEGEGGRRAGEGEVSEVNEEVQVDRFKTIQKVVVNKIHEVGEGIQDKAMAEISKMSKFVPSPEVGKTLFNGALIVGGAYLLNMV